VKRGEEGNLLPTEGKALRIVVGLSSQFSKLVLLICA